MKLRILSIIVISLAAGVLGSCTVLPFSQLSVQSQQQASYVYYRMTEPKIAALRIVNKQGDVLLKPEMTRPKIKAFASVLADYAGYNHSHEFAGNIKMPQNEYSKQLYIETLDSDGKLIERFAVIETAYVQSDTFLLRYGLGTKHLNIISKVCPLEYALTPDEMALLQKHFSTKSHRK